jgi:hypothetical protein
MLGIGNVIAWMKKKLLNNTPATDYFFAELKVKVKLALPMP